MSSAAARRFDAPHTPKPAFAAPSPVPAFAPSPQAQKRSYVDVGTQYTPTGFPPTHHPQPPPELAQLDGPTGDDPAPALHTFPATVQPPRGESSAASVVTEPPEPQLRVDPQPVTPAQNAETQSRRAVREASRPAEPAVAQTEQSVAVTVPDSPAKRARPQDPNVKVMPLQYETCDVKDLGILISGMLMELVRLNDGYPLRDGTLTRFHSR